MFDKRVVMPILAAGAAGAVLARGETGPLL